MAESVGWSNIPYEQQFRLQGIQVMAKVLYQIAPVVANATLDLCGSHCLSPLIYAKRLMEELQDGQVLLLFSDCPGIKDDLFSWARHMRHEILQIRKTEPEKTEYYIRKGKGPAREANVCLDMRGVACPWPIIRARRAIAGMQAGETLKLISSCSAAPNEVSTWSCLTGHHVIEVREIDNDVHEFYIRKR